MEITNICPYCGKEMKDGALPTYKSPIRWCPSNGRGCIVEGEYVTLSNMPFIGSAYAPARYCEGCGVVIVPVPDQEEVKDGLTKAFERLGRGLESTFGALGDKMDKAAERRKEEEAARKREERRKKDPWEV